MARQSDEERLAKQRARQQEARRRNAATKRPDRDDVARTALFWLIRRMARRTPHELNAFQNRIIKLLVEQGFDRQASDAVLEDLVEKYRTGELPFRRKVHLLFPDGPPDGSETDD
jgi:hypothetical protein